MKEVVSLLLITLILSCSKDDESAIPSIVNTWNLDSQSLKNCWEISMLPNDDADKSGKELWFAHVKMK